MRGSSPRPRSAAVAATRPDLVYLLRGTVRPSICGLDGRAGWPGRPRSRFLLGFLLAALVIAGGLSYFASSDPDGLDSVTLHGCTVSETAEGEQLDGTCIAQNAAAQYPAGHQMAGSPLADYAVGGREGTTGLAGIIGVLVTALRGGPAVPGAASVGRRTGHPRRGLTGDGRGPRPPAVPAGHLGGAPAARRGEDRRGVARRGLRGGDAARGVRGVRRAPRRARRRLGGRAGSRPAGSCAAR